MRYQLEFISPPRNSWNHRLLLSVTLRRANDVPRRSHLARLRLTTFMDRYHLARLRLTIRPLKPHKGIRSSVTSLHTSLVQGLRSLQHDSHRNPLSLTPHQIKAYDVTMYISSWCMSYQDSCQSNAHTTTTMTIISFIFMEWRQAQITHSIAKRPIFHNSTLYHTHLSHNTIHNAQC